MKTQFLKTYTQRRHTRAFSSLLFWEWGTISWTVYDDAKHNWAEVSRVGKIIVEEILDIKFEHDLIYDKAYLLTSITKDERLIEPTFDNPKEHLGFYPEFYFYESKTKIGDITIPKTLLQPHDLLYNL